MGTEVGMAFHFGRTQLSIFTMEEIMGKKNKGSLAAPTSILAHGN